MNSRKSDAPASLFSLTPGTDRLYPAIKYPPMTIDPKGFVTAFDFGRLEDTSGFFTRRGRARSLRRSTYVPYYDHDQERASPQ